LTLTQNLFGRPLKPKMIAERMAGVLGAESATALQDGPEPQGTSLQSRSSKSRPQLPGTAPAGFDEIANLINVNLGNG
jgi:hypothetical protein